MFGHGSAGVGEAGSPVHQSETFVHAKAERTGSRSFLLDPSDGSTTEECMNNVKTLVLMAGLMGLFLLAGQGVARLRPPHARQDRDRPDRAARVVLEEPPFDPAHPADADRRDE